MYSQTHNLLKPANKLLEQEQFNAALPFWESVVAEHPKNANYNFKLGLCYYKAVTNKSVALSYFEAATASMVLKYDFKDLKENSAPYDALFFLAEIYTYLNKPQKALITYLQYQQAVENQTAFAVDSRIQKCIVLLQSENKGNGVDVLNNALIPHSVNITYEHDFSKDEMHAFFDSLTQRVVKGELAVYSPMDRLSALQKNSLQLSLSGIDVDALHQLVFEEQWYVNRQQFSMEKKVNACAPVYEHYRQTDTFHLDMRKTLLFWHNYEKESQEDTAFICINNVSYEFNLYNSVSPSWVADLSPETFVNFILKQSYASSCAVYDYETNAEITTEQVQERLIENGVKYRFPNDTASSNDVALEPYSDLSRVRSVLFVEDWYIDKNNLQIRKKVKQIAPVFSSFYFDETDENEKVIPFIITLN